MHSGVHQGCQGSTAIVRGSVPAVGYPLMTSQDKRSKKHAKRSDCQVSSVQVCLVQSATLTPYHSTVVNVQVCESFQDKCWVLGPV